MKIKYKRIPNIPVHPDPGPIINRDRMDMKHIMEQYGVPVTEPAPLPNVPLEGLRTLPSEILEAI